MAEKTKTVETKVEQVDVNIDEIFSGAPGGDSITLPEEDKKPNIFSRKDPVDMGFVDEDTKEEVKEEEEENKEKEVESKEETPKKEEKKEIKEEVDVDEVLGLKEEDSTETKKPGRKKIEGIADVFSKLIKEEKILGFDDEKDLNEYSAKDWEELIHANLQEKANQVRRETPQKFFESLPQELQLAARYVADGGTDLKGLFRTLSVVEETKDLDPKTEKGQETIIREYLTATGYGDVEEINEEIEVWKDLGKLQKQANKFKPKLDKMQEKVIEKKLKEQELKKKQQQQASQNYMKNVYDTLKNGKIGDTKVDRKTQSLLYNGLVNPAYPSITGQNTNLLGHLLEKYQFVEPNYPLIAEALWLLADPKGFKNKLKKKGEVKAVEKTVRKLKTAQAQEGNASTGIVEKESTRSASRKKLPRSQNIFKRF